MRSFLLTFLAVVLGALSVSLLPTSSVNAAPTNVCNAQVVMVGVAGSGQNWSEDQPLPPFDRYGRQAADVAIVLQSKIEKTNFSYAVDVVAYPATDFYGWATGGVNDTETYSSSRDVGVATLKQLLDSYRNCANGSPKVILMGYSQGSDVIKSFIFNQEAVGNTSYRNQIIGIALIADPKFDPNDSSYKIGSYQTTPITTFNVYNLKGRTLFGQIPQGVFGKRAVSSAYASKTINLCNQYDPVCNYQDALTLGVHINSYFGQTMRETGEYLAGKFNEYANNLGSKTNWDVYKDNIVRWQDGTSWYVKADGRYWIQYPTDYRCFLNKGATVYNLPAAALTAIPDITGSWAKCSSSTSPPTATAPSWNGLGSYTFRGGNVLTPGMKLYPNQYILTNNAKAYLVLQSDGNLVLYGERGKYLWDSGTAGQNVYRLVMQGDGNLVLYRANGTAAWHTGTYGRNGARLVLQDDGNLVIYSTTNVPLWYTKTNGRIATSPTIAYSGQMTARNTLYRDQALRSPDKKYVLMLQTDGNLVLYGPGYNVLWNSETQGYGADRVVMQDDGNFVLYKGQNAIWQTNTDGSVDAVLRLQNDKNLVIYETFARAIWWPGKKITFPWTYP